MKFLVASQDMSPPAAETLAIANGCAGFYMTCPPVWRDQAQAEQWSYPCIVTMNDEGTIGGWSPVAE